MWQTPLLCTLFQTLSSWVFVWWTSKPWNGQILWAAHPAAIQLLAFGSCNTRNRDRFPFWARLCICFLLVERFLDDVANVSASASELWLHQQGRKSTPHSDVDIFRTVVGRDSQWAHTHTLVSSHLSLAALGLQDCCDAVRNDELPVKAGLSPAVAKCPARERQEAAIRLRLSAASIRDMDG